MAAVRKAILRTTGS